MWRTAFRAVVVALAFAGASCFIGSAQARECPLPPRAVTDLQIGTFYADGSNSVRDPEKGEAYRVSMRDVTRFLNLVAKQSDDYATTKDPETRSCAMSALARWARGDGLEGKLSFPGQTNRAWALGSVCLAYLKLGGDRDPTRDGQVETWLADLADGVVAFQATRRQKFGDDAETNLYYWAGAAVGCAGVALKRDDYWKFGAEAFNRAMDNIGPDGVLPIELRRKQRASSYQGFASQPLVLLARLGRYKGDDLYGRNRQALDRLVGLVLKLRAEPQFLAERAGAGQDPVDEPRWLRLLTPLNDRLLGDAKLGDLDFSDRRFGGNLKVLDETLVAK